MGTWFMFLAQFNQLVWVTFRGFFLCFLGQKLMWGRDCFGGAVVMLAVPWVPGFPLLLLT